MNGFRQHTAKAAIGIGACFVFLIIPLVGVRLDPERKFIWLWVLLLFSTMPAVGWGATHLAMSRGYPGASGFAISIIGYVVAGMLGTTLRHPTVFGIGVLFIILFPVVILLALPRKHRRHHRRQHHDHIAQVER
jgi:4-amino-4-deoxy-L-arabinose transferase-like glycosyltransferase